MSSCRDMTFCEDGGVWGRGRQGVPLILKKVSLPLYKTVFIVYSLFSSARDLKAFFPALQTGQRQSSGKSSKRVPGGILPRLSPRSGSYT